MEKILNMFKALGDESRLRILLMLRIRPLCVCEINQVLNIALSTTSQHLKQLKFAGLIEDSKEGRWVTYKLSGQNTFFTDLLKNIETKLWDHPKIKKDRSTISTVTREECWRNLKQKQAGL
ncbi:MAG: ArsR/SmtB family transcription factor [Spirochaetota bacterium]